MQRNTSHTIKACLILILTFMLRPVQGQAVTDSVKASTSVTLHTQTGDIEGTLTIPLAAERMPVALIIAGSGPTDRDGNGPLIKTDTYKQLAHALSLHKIAALRYDKRGVGKSMAAMKSEKELRFDDYVQDAREWIAWMRQDKRFTGIILIGHSEGSLVGMLAAQEGVDRFISLAGAGFSADSILKQQLGAQPLLRERSFSIIDSLKAGLTVAQVPPMLFTVFRPSVQPYMISWFKYDPAMIIARLNIPVLILQGTNDLQINVADAERLHAANAKSELVILDGVNHVLKKVADMAENQRSYRDPALLLDERLVNAIVGFTKRR
ncbi:MAG TPA: alpha/beta fold hydrolase [Ferruginibacter sp.]|nr:alpha/beta fold hydrolase [Ferruginibacter sp.]